MKREYRVVKDSKGTIIVLTTYGNKTFKGTAKLADGDEYNEEFGVKLATLRCKKKLFKAKYKVAMAKKKLYELYLDKIEKLVNEVKDYATDCMNNFCEVDEELKEMLKAN